MSLDLPPIPDAERSPLVGSLLAILDSQQQRSQQLEETVQPLRDESAVRKGQKPRPSIAPSRLETPPTRPPGGEGDPRPGSAKRSKNACFLTPIAVYLPFPDPPPGAVSQGYEEYLVQELVMEGRVTRYRRERIRTVDGRTLRMPLPDTVLPGRHYGPVLIG
jgi:hypothetical protein